MVIDIRALSDPQPLFSSQDSFALTDAYMREAMHAVQTIPADAFLNTPTEDIISSLVERHGFTPPILKRDEAYTRWAPRGRVCAAGISVKRFAYAALSWPSSFLSKETLPFST